MGSRRSALPFRRVTVVHSGALLGHFFGGRFEPLLKRLLARGLDVTVVAPAVGARSIHKLLPQLDVIELAQPIVRMSRPGILVNYAAGHLSGLGIDVDTDVTLALTGVANDVHLTKRIGARAGAKTVAYIDNITPRGRPGPRWWVGLDELGGRFAESAYKDFDLCIAGSSAVADSLAKIGVSPSRIYLTSYGLDEEALRLGRRSNPQRIPGRAIYLGRFSEGKGVFDLLLAWPRIAASVDGASLRIMGLGNAQEEARLKAIIESADLKRSVTLLGFVSSEEKFRELLSARALLFPTYSEQYSQAVAEALSCGLEVVAYDIEGFRHNFPGLINTGPIGDVDNYARRAIEVLSTPLADRTIAIETSHEKFIDAELDAIARLF